MADKHEETHHQEDPKAAFKAGAPGVAAKIWRAYKQPNPAAAAAWFNLSPAQQAGEAMVSNRSDGAVDVYAFF
jgi:hypothetical protein